MKDITYTNENLNTYNHPKAFYLMTLVHIHSNGQYLGVRVGAEARYQQNVNTDPVFHKYAIYDVL